jgi:polyhydroxybutyrate depolymerase
VALLLAAVVFPATAIGAAHWPGGIHCDSRSGKFVKGVNCRVLLPPRSSTDQTPRRYVAWMPQKARDRIADGDRVPVVVMLHGASGTGEAFLGSSGWKELAAVKGLIAVFPTGERYRIDSPGPPHMSTRWSDYHLADDVDETYRPPANDADFLRRMMTAVGASAKVDGERRYLSGFSNGASLCLRGAMELSDVFAAFGCNAGTLKEKHTITAGHPYRPVALTIGNQDDHILDPYQASHPGATEFPMNPEAPFSTLEPQVGFVLESLRLSETYDALVEPPSVNVFRFDEPAPGHKNAKPMQFTLLRHVGHEYPNGKNNPEHFHMAQMLWPYFEQNHG